MSKQTAINADEITNALDVYNITPDPTDNTQLKQLLTQMDNKIDQAVSGGEIIGSFWYGQTTPGFTVPAPTMIGQTYIDFTTLNHYISNDGSTWTLNGTLTLPSTQDAIVLITAKFWDIIEQQNQYGGRAIYSQDLTQWIYYPTIIDLSGYAHTNMDNLDSTGKNISNWSSNVSNCITEIPQDIKLELNNGTLTLKAGSKVYVPNGTGVFDEVLIANDVSVTVGYSDKRLMFYNPTTNQIFGQTSGECSSGNNAPSGSAYMVWYDTTNNVIKFTNNGGSTWTQGISLPFAIVQTGSGVVTSIDQVFNGFGDIGSTVFALPGVKGLIPNGRNADGSLKNTEVTVTAVNTMNMASWMPGRTHCVLNLFTNASIGGMDISNNDWGSVAYLKDIPRVANSCWYCEEDNLVHYFNGNAEESINPRAFVGSFDVVSNNKISSLGIKQPFHAVDYSDLQQIYKNLQPVLENDFYSAPNWTAQTTIASGATITKIGYVYAYTAGSDHSLLLSINGNQVGGSSSSHAGKSRSGLCAVGVGDVVTATGSSPTIYFVPCLLS